MSASGGNADIGQPLLTDPDIRIYALAGSEKFHAHAVVLPPNKPARPEGTSAVERQVKPVRNARDWRAQDAGAGNV